MIQSKFDFEASIDPHSPWKEQPFGIRNAIFFHHVLPLTVSLFPNPWCYQEGEPFADHSLKAEQVERAHTVSHHDDQEEKMQEMYRGITTLCGLDYDSDEEKEVERNRENFTEVEEPLTPTQSYFPAPQLLYPREWQVAVPEFDYSASASNGSEDQDENKNSDESNQKEEGWTVTVRVKRSASRIKAKKRKPLNFELSITEQEKQISCYWVTKLTAEPNPAPRKELYSNKRLKLNPRENASQLGKKGKKIFHPRTTSGAVYHGNVSRKNPNRTKKRKDAITLL